MSVRLVLVFALSAMCSSVFAQPTIVRYGNDVHVEAGQTVEDVVTMGGDAQIDGDVEGDVVTMGGDVRIDGEVEGDVVTMGGDVRITGTVEGDVVSNGGTVEVRSGGQVEGRIVDHQGVAFAFDGGPQHHGHQFNHRFDHQDHEYDGYGASVIRRIESAADSFFLKAASFGVLLLIALGFHIGARNRFDAMQVAMLRRPGRSFLLGLLAKIGAVVGLVVLLLTIVGIPAALVGGVTLAFASYVGLAVVASVVGAMLPVENLRDRDNLRVAAGVATLFGVSLIPYVGALAMFIAGAIGLGALIQTRIGSKPTPPSEGPYRTAPEPSL